MNAITPGGPPLPPARTSPLAIWSLVLSLLGFVLLCIGPFFAIPGVICGHLAHSRIKRSGGTLEGHGLALGGLITGYVVIALSVVAIPMMAAIAIPNFVKARSTAQRNACINNLRQIDAAKEQWSLEEKKDAGAIPTEADLKSYFGEDGLPMCPAKGSYTLKPLGELPVCSIPEHVLP